MQRVQHGDRVRLRRVAAEEQNALGILLVVVGVGHRAIAPGVRHAGDRRRVADARLMVHVVGAEHGHELAEQVGLLVAVLGGTDPEGGIGPAILADREQLVAYFFQRLIPRDLLPFATDELHRGLQAVRVVRHAVLADRSALGAVRAEVDRRIEYRLLADPHAVLNHGVDRATDGAVRTDRALDLDLATGVLRRFGFFHDVERQLRRHGAGAERDARTLQESAAIDRSAEHARNVAGKTARARGNAGGFSREQHGALLRLWWCRSTCGCVP